MDSIKLAVGGMTCGGCVGSVTRVLQALDGVTDVEVSLEQGAALVRYDPARVQAAQMVSAVQAAGFDCAA